MQINTVQKISDTAIQLREMQEQINIDVARAALACAQAGDADLMGQLVYALSPEHDFIPCLTAMQIQLEVRGGNEGGISKAERYRDVLATVVKDHTSALTDNLEVESDERMSFFEMVLRHVPSSSLGDLAGEMLEHFQQREVECIYSRLSGEDMDCLKAIHDLRDTSF
jgi:hypothetical protein